MSLSPEMKIPRIWSIGRESCGKTLTEENERRIAAGWAGKRYTLPKRDVSERVIGESSASSTGPVAESAR